MWDWCDVCGHGTAWFYHSEALDCFQQSNLPGQQGNKSFLWSLIRYCYLIMNVCILKISLFSPLLSWNRRSESPMLKAPCALEVIQNVISKLTRSHLFLNRSNYFMILRFFLKFNFRSKISSMHAWILVNKSAGWSIVWVITFLIALTSIT